MFTYFGREKEKVQMSGGRDREREGERESQAGSTLSSWSLTRGLISRTVKPRPEPKSNLSHPGAPKLYINIIKSGYKRVQ